jgi:hypothetical protein
MVDGLWQEKQCNLIQFRVTGSPCEYYRCNRATHRQKKKGCLQVQLLPFKYLLYFIISLLNMLLFFFFQLQLPS